MSRYGIIRALRRGGRAVEGARLESVYTETYRGFESLPLRHTVCSRDTYSVVPPQNRQKARLCGLFAFRHSVIVGWGNCRSGRKHRSAPNDHFASQEWVTCLSPEFWFCPVMNRHSSSTVMERYDCSELEVVGPCRTSFQCYTGLAGVLRRPNPNRFSNLL